jgi:4-coumarate--CoA ligase
MLANTLQVTHCEDFGSHMMAVLPFFHIYAMMLMHVAMYQGAANVVLPRFEPETFLHALSKYKIEKANIAPPIAIFLAHHPMVDQYDLSSTKFLVSGGAPMGKEVEALVTKRLNVKVKQAYGMTEASPAVNYTEDAFRKPVRLDLCLLVRLACGYPANRRELTGKCWSPHA